MAKIYQNRGGTLTPILDTATFVDISTNQTVAGNKSFTGTVTAKNPTTGDVSSKVATTKFVHDELVKYTTIYEEKYTASATVSSGSTITIPSGVKYVVGVNSLEVYYNGLIEYRGSQYNELGTQGQESNTIAILHNLEAGDELLFRIGAVHSDTGSGTATDPNAVHKTGSESIDGVKTFTASPIVPTPANDNAATPIFFIRDMLRAEVEALSDGRNTVIRDYWDIPHYMVVIPRFRLEDIDSSLGSGVHPAFIVNGVQKSEILMGKYIASKSSSSHVLTVPHAAPWVSINWDNALSACRALSTSGNKFGMTTQVMYAARDLWLTKYHGGTHVYYGNSQYGRSYDATYLTGTMKNTTYLPGDTANGDAATLTGTGGVKWNDDETPFGVADLVGNVVEWAAGCMFRNGEINIIPNNDGLINTTNMSQDSSAWKAVLQDGSLVFPGTANTLKFDSTAASRGSTSWTNVGGHARLCTTITNQLNANEYTGWYAFKSLDAASGITVPAILKQYGIMPTNTYHQGSMTIANGRITMPLRGGHWGNTSYCGPSYLHANGLRSSTNANIGFRASCYAG